MKWACPPSVFCRAGSPDPAEGSISLGRSNRFCHLDSSSPQSPNGVSYTHHSSPESTVASSGFANQLAISHLRQSPGRSNPAKMEKIGNCPLFVTLFVKATNDVSHPYWLQQITTIQQTLYQRTWWCLLKCRICDGYVYIMEKWVDYKWDKKEWTVEDRIIAMGHCLTFPNPDPDGGELCECEASTSGLHPVKCYANWVYHQLPLFGGTCTAIFRPGKEEWGNLLYYYWDCDYPKSQCLYS